MRSLTLIIAFYGFSLSGFTQNWTEHLVPSQIGTTHRAITADIDGDGNLDILRVSGSGQENFAWFHNEDGLGNFGPLQIIGNIQEPRFITSGDLDGDGDIDVIGSCPFASTDKLVWYENLDGQGTFSSVNVINTATQGQGAVAVADIDGDGDNDLIVNSQDDRTLAWYKNLDGQGTFGASQIVITDYITSSGLAVDDMDGDGDMDIVVGTPGTRRMSWFENLDRLGNFGPPNMISTPGLAILFVFIADFDGDGDNDIVGTSGAIDLVAWWENMDGLGNFSSERNISLNVDAPFDVFATDLDNDNDMDVLVTSAPESSVLWFENLDGLGNFSEKKTITNDLFATISVFAADIDGDGDQDVISGTQSIPKLAWYENPTILSVEENSIDTVKIYPNPTDGLLYIDANTESIIGITVFDVLGKKVLQLQGNKQQVDISTIESGMYFLRIATDRGEFVQKIIKE